MHVIAFLTFTSVYTRLARAGMTLQASKPPNCLKVDSCSCKWDTNGSMVDLHAVGKEGGIRFKNQLDLSGMFKFSYNPCYPFTQTAQGLLGVDDCKGVASCENDNVNFYDGGLHNNSQFFTQSLTSGGEDWIVILQYTSADLSRQTQVWLFCAPYENLTVIGETPGTTPTTFIYWLYSPHACPVTPRISVGTILCILFPCLLVSYLLIGFLYMKFVKHTEGVVEAIPNISFWKSSPNLVKDGAQFIFSGCSKTKKGYESIG